MPARPTRPLWSAALSALLILALGACAEEEQPAAPQGPLPELPDPDGDDLLPDLTDESDPTDAPVDLEHLGDRLYGLPVLHVEVPHDDLIALLNDPSRRDEIPVAVRYNGRVWADAALELHGGFARTAPKRSFRLELPDDDRLWIAFDGPLEGHREIVLQASWIDPTLLRNRLTFEAARTLGGLAPRTTFAPLAFNGRFYGFYIVIERVDEVFLWRNGLDRSGSLYKAENHNANWAWRQDVLAGYAVQLHAERPPDDLDALLRAVTYTPADEAALQREVAPLLSLDDLHAWQLVHSYAQNLDTFTKNYYLYHDIAAPAGSPEARFRLVSWDADATWGMNWDGQPVPSDREAWHGTDRFSPRLFSIPEQRARYLGAWRVALEGPLHPDALNAQIDDAWAKIGPLVALDLRVWPRGRGAQQELEALRQSVVERQERMLRVVGEVEAEP